MFVVRFCNCELYFVLLWLIFFIHVMEGLFLAAREKCNMHLSKLIESNHKDPA